MLRLLLDDIADVDTVFMPDADLPLLLFIHRMHWLFLFIHSMHWLFWFIHSMHGNLPVFLV